FETSGETHVAYEVFTSMLVDEAPACIGSEAGHSEFDLIVGDAERLHHRDDRGDAVLAHFAADRNDLCDSGYREELWSNHEIGQFSHVHGRYRAVTGERDQHDLAHDGGQGAHLRIGPSGKLLADERQPLRYELTRAIDIDSPIELNVDDG